MSLKAKELYDFGEFRLDVAEHTLTRSDGSNNGQLPEKAFQTLIILVRNSGRLLTKQELIDQIWPDSFVEENNLDKCVHAIRLVLGEKPGEQKFIETVRKHGYRFVATVSTLGTRPEEPASLLDSEFLTEPTTFKTHSRPTISTTTTKSGAFVVSAKWNPEDQGKIVQESGNSHWDSTVTDQRPALKPKPTSWTIKRLVIVAILLLAGVAPTIYFTIVRSTESTAVAGTKSFAVLPLKPIDPANRSDIFEIGIAESLIQRLSSIKGFVVRPLSSTRKYTEIAQDPLAAGREQKVDYVLGSNYQLADGKIRITSQLLHVANGQIEDTFTVVTDSANLFSAQDAIAHDIGKRILARFGSDAGEFHARRGTNNEDAYRFYLMAMNLSEERSEEKVQRSLEYLDRAVALDPGYASAWAAKAHTHRDIATHPGSDQHEQYRKSMDAISKALAIDPNISDAYSALCHNRNRYEYDTAGAEAACRRALELEPNSSVAHKTYANFLYSRGKFDEAIAEIRIAMDLQPVSYRNQQIYALALYYARRYDEAEAHFKRLIELNPNHTHIHVRLIMVLEQQEKESEAFEYLVKMLVIRNDDKKLERVRAAYQASGWRGVLIEQIKTAEAAASPPSFDIARWYTRIGNTEKALEHLENAYKERSPLIAMLEEEPQLEPLRNNPRFADLIRRVEGK